MSGVSFFFLFKNVLTHAIISITGTPSSMQASKEQWDYPNAWPPLQAFIIQGLDRTNQRLAQIIAFRLAQVWLGTNYKGYDHYQMMFEKVRLLFD